MGYIGQEPSVGGYELLTISGTINGSNTSFTLSKAPASANHLLFLINGVLQYWDAFSVSGTTLTTTSAPATGSTMEIMMLGSVYDIGKPSDGSVSLASMASESVDEDNLHISNAGSNGQFLSKQSGNAGGLTWATPTDNGKVLQVLIDYATAVTVNSTSFVDSGLSVQITPSSTSSKILCDFGTAIYKNSTTEMAGGWRLMRDSTEIYTTGNHYVYSQGAPDNQAETRGGENQQYLDSPNTTSAVTYKVQVQVGSTNAAIQFNRRGHLTVMEIGA